MLAATRAFAAAWEFVFAAAIALLQIVIAVCVAAHHGLGRSHLALLEAADTCVLVLLFLPLGKLVIDVLFHVVYLRCVKSVVAAGGGGHNNHTAMLLGDARPIDDPLLKADSDPHECLLRFAGCSSHLQRPDDHLPDNVAAERLMDFRERWDGASIEGCAVCGITFTARGERESYTLGLRNNGEWTAASEILAAEGEEQSAAAIDESPFHLALYGGKVFCLHPERVDDTAFQRAKHAARR